MNAIAPMLLGTATRIPEQNDRLVLEPKADGIRIILRCDASRRLRLSTRHGTDITALLDRIDGELGRIPAGTILDGELVALARRPDGCVGFEFDAVMSEVLRSPSTRGRGGVQLQVMMFDCLEWCGVALDGETWEARRGRLEEVTASAAVPSMPVFDCGPDTFDDLVSLGMEGVVLKERAGRYYRGRRSRTWRKHKARGEADCGVLSAHPDRSTGVIERVAVHEPGAAVSSWVRVFKHEHRALLASPAHRLGEMRARVGFTYRSPAGRLREARLLAVDTAEDWLAAASSSDG